MNIKRNRSAVLVSNVFFLTVFTFFLTSLMTTLGSVIDGFIIGNTMGTKEIGACSLASPMWFIMSIFYNVLAMGCQPFCAQELGRGRPDQARELFSMTVMLGITLTIVFSVLTIIFNRPVTRLLGAAPDQEVYLPCRLYLIGSVLGIPAMAAINLLSIGLNLEGARRQTLYAAAVMTLTNIFLDLLVVYIFPRSMFLMGLTTSLSYYAGVGVLLVYYLRKRKDILLKPTFCRMSLRTIRQVAWRGMPLGVSRMTTAVKAAYLNHLLASSVTAVGLAAYNVQVQINYLTNALFMGVAQALSLMISVYYAEENRRGMKQTVLIAIGYEVLFGVIILLLLFNSQIRPQILRFYLGSNEDSYTAASIGIYFFARGLFGQAFAVLFANYLQTTGRTRISNLVYVLCDVLLVVLFVTYRRAGISSYDTSEPLRMGMTFYGVSEAQLWMIAVIPVLVLFIALFMKNRPRPGWDTVLMLPRDFGVPEDRELTATPATIEEVAAFSQQIYDFCLQHGVGPRQANITSLAAEEMAKNVIEHGFTKDNRRHSMELRLICKNDELILRIRDNCRLFDPIKRLATINENPDPTAYIGIRMIMKLATDVSYTTTMKQNNLMIKVALQ